MIMKQIIAATAFSIVMASQSLAQEFVTVPFDGSFDDATFAVESAIVGQGLGYRSCEPCRRDAEPNRGRCRQRQADIQGCRYLHLLFSHSLARSDGGRSDEYRILSLTVFS